MKRCLGCGVELQNEDKRKKGYVRSLDQDYCMRCFRLTHYGDSLIDLRLDIKREDVLHAIKTDKRPVAFIVDIMNIESAISNDMIDALRGREVVLIFNKYDILPKNINSSKIEEYLDAFVSEKMQGIRVIDVIITHKYDDNFAELFLDTLNNHQISEIMFCGNVNAGKSTIINKLIEGSKLTVSRFPSTTLDFNVIKQGDLTFIDTPGIIDEGDLSLYVDEKELKRLSIDKTIRPQTFQLYEAQSYFVESLLWLDVLPKDKGSVVFFVSNNLSIHRTKTAKAAGYYDHHRDDYKLKLQLDSVKEIGISDVKTEIEVDGLGVIALNNIAKIVVHHDKRNKVTIRKAAF